MEACDVFCRFQREIMLVLHGERLVLWVLGKVLELCQAK
jgi:hypothetical protein